MTAHSLPALQEKADGLYALVRGDTVGWFFENVWAETRRHVKAATVEADKKAMAHVLDAFAMRPLSDVTRQEVQQAVNRWATRFRPSTVGQIFARLASMFRLAVLDGYVPSSPCQGVRLPKIQSRPAVAADCANLWAVAESQATPAARNALRLMLLGLRRGEAAGAMREGLANGVLVVSQQRTRAGVHDPKTPESARRLPLPAWLAGKLLADSGDRGGCDEEATGQVIS